MSHLPKKYLLNQSKLLMCFIMTSIVVAKNQPDSVRIDPDCMILKINNYIDTIYNHKWLLFLLLFCSYYYWAWPRINQILSPWLILHNIVTYSFGKPYIFLLLFFVISCPLFISISADFMFIFHSFIIFPCSSKYIWFKYLLFYPFTQWAAVMMKWLQKELLIITL